MLIALCGPRGRALKADQSLSDLIMKLKADCLRIQGYLHISLMRIVGRYKSYAFGSVYLLDVDLELPDTWLG
jgi:hypothetical protein